MIDISGPVMSRLPKKSSNNYRLLDSKRNNKKENYFDNEKIKHNLKMRAIKGASATIISKVIIQVLQLASTIVLARILTPNDFGLVTMVTSIFVLFRIIRNLGLYDSTIQEDKIDYYQISKLFWINAGFGLLLTVVFISLAPLMAWFYGEKELIGIAALISLDFLIGSLATQHRALLQRNLLIYRLAINEIISAIISISAAVLLALNGFGYWALVLRYVIYAACETIGAWIFCRWVPTIKFHGAKVKHMVKFGIDMIKNLALNYFSQNMDKILIGRYWGAQSLGFYNRAFYLFMAPAEQLSYPLTGVAVGTLSRLRNNREKYKRYYLNSLSVLAFIGMPLSAILTAMGHDFVYMLLGPQWHSAGTIFSILGLGIAIQIIYGTHAWLHISLARPDRWFKWNIISSVSLLIAFIAGIPFGAVGVAAGYVFAIYIIFIPGIWYAGNTIGLTILSVINILWKYFLSAMASGIICWITLFHIPHISKIILNLNVFFRIFIGTIFISICYLGFVIILYQGTQPIKQFLTLLNEILRKETSSAAET
jgi:PST family polysaccharide transporter